jgi:kynureninase
MLVDEELLSYRERFPILGHTVYLINHSLGAMPAAVAAKMQEYVAAWGERGIRAWEEGWWEMPLRTGDKLARLLGAAPGSVVMHQNVSVCQSLILSCFAPGGGRNRIVYESLNFPSVKYVYTAHARQNGWEVVEVPSDDGMTVDTNRMIDAIDERTLLVPISHVIFRSAAIQDVAAIVEKAHRVGAYVVLDVYQSAGTVPFSLAGLGVDFATGGSVKWLCGGPGAGYLYVRPDLAAHFEPAATGWAAHRQPFAFADEMEYAGDHHRYLTGTPGIPTLYAAESGYDLINEVGVERIRARSRRQTTRLIELADERGWRVNSPRQPDRRGGSVVIDLPGGAGIVRELARREILIDYRPGAGIRVGPHFFNTDEEIERLVAEIDSILAAGASQDLSAS